DSGTLFLDEIGDISPGMQVKLLRVLQEGEFQRVGSNRSLPGDARIIAATHRDLEALVREGTFREDLFYRLNVISVRVPALRERREDIPELSEVFLKFYARKNGKELRGISRSAMDLLVRYPYPGNVRELENAMERAVVMARGSVLVREDLPATLLEGKDAARPTAGPEEGSLPDRLEAMERASIEAAMEKAEGVQSRAARYLGINERNLRYKLKKYGLK
ncbi:MAG: sigma 54-interacting transcriptional regulator, partial [bacterium]|nr:sigma 54-interacting transcriptional regulator [bacterium]